MHRHLLPLTPLRFIAAMSVVIFHFWRGVFPFDTAWPLVFAKNGNLAVSFFYCLSGFIMAAIYRGSTVPPMEYWMARIARLYPVYFLIALAWIVAVGAT